MTKLKKLQPSVCIDAVLADVPIDKALAAISKLGFKAFEFWCWWEKDLDEMNRVRNELNLSVAACCTKFISMTNPENRDEYLAGLVDSIEAAKKLDCVTLISQVGDLIVDRSREEQNVSIVAALKQAAPLLEAAGVTIVIEPLNEKVDHPGYFLIHSDEAFEIVNAVGSPNVKVVFDIYHQQISEGNLIPNIISNIQQIGHFHAAGHPGRNELTTGEINYPEVLKAIEKCNFSGYIGLEYWPKQDPEVGLGQIAEWFE